MGRSIARAASHGALLLVGLATLARADVVELMNGQRLQVTLKKDERQFILQTRGSHWINEAGY